jgi:hypothetical protein
MIGGNGFLAHIFDGVLIAQPVRALDGVVHMKAPVILAHVAEAAEMPPCAATVCERVGNTLVMQAVFRPFSAMPNVARKTCAAGADDDDVIFMIDDFVGLWSF